MPCFPLKFWALLEQLSQTRPGQYTIRIKANKEGRDACRLSLWHRVGECPREKQVQFTALALLAVG
jgi:hypothetical protein